MPIDNNDLIALIEKIVEEKTKRVIGQMDVLPNSIKKRHIDLTDGVDVDTIDEKTSGEGVTIDSVLLKDGGATLTEDLQVADAKDIKFASGVKLERVDGHLVLTPESSKLVKTTALEQSTGGTNTYRNNAIILTGFDQWTGSATNAGNNAVTFGITFTTTPVLVISLAQADDRFQAIAHGGASTTGFVWYWRNNSATETAVDINWIAIGTL